MKSQFFLTITTLTMTCALLLTALAQDPKLKLDPNKIPKVTTKVMLPCKNGGGHQDVAKVMEITNSSSQVLKTDALINYSASDGDHGTRNPDANVAPGK